MISLKYQVSEQCRLLPPTQRVSVSLLEKTDAQIPLTRDRVVPTTGPRSMEVRDDDRPGAVAHDLLR
jgi:hypothetical protein